MNSYFLLICTGDRSTSECVYEKVLKDSSSVKRQFDGSQSLNSVHQAIISSSTDEQSDNHEFTWKRKRPASEQITGTSCDLNDKVACHISQLSEAIHALLDQLPVYGNYLLDIFIDGDFFNLLKSNDEEIELFGALLRCVLWHNGLITSIHRSKILTHKWADYLRASEITIQDDVPEVSWRGNLRFGMADSASSTVIPGMQLSWHKKIKQPSEVSLTGDCKDDGEVNRFMICNEIQVLQEFSVTCLPAYLFSTAKYRLYIPLAYHGCESAKEFFQYVQSNPEIGFIARLPYSTFQSSKSRANLPLPKTEDWKNAILNSDLNDFPKVLELQLENSQSTHFLIFWDDSCPPSSAWALQLRHPSDLDMSFCSEEVFPSSGTLTRDDVKLGVQNLLKHLPHFSLKALNSLQNLILKSHSLYPNLEQVSNVEIPMLESKLSEIEAMIIQSCFTKENFFERRVAADELPKTLLPDIDPNDWPERRYLLLRNFREKTNENPSDSHLKNALDFEAADVLTLFDSSGESRLKDSTNLVGQKICSTKPQNSLDETLQTSWPDTIHCHFHDIYYNVNDATEQKEHACNLARELCVLSETSSTCNMERPITRSTLQPSKRKRDASGMALRRSPRRPAQNCSPGTNCNNENGKKSMPLRRSPRKHLRQKQCSKSSQEQKMVGTENNQDSRKGIQNTKQKDLSELHKKKLREAVAVALETEGISMDDATFRACGRRLFNVCKAFVSDVIGKGRTSMLMKKIAKAHVKQVIEFENLTKETKSAR